MGEFTNGIEDDSDSEDWDMRRNEVGDVKAEVVLEGSEMSTYSESVEERGTDDAAAEEDIEERDIAENDSANGDSDTAVSTVPVLLAGL